MLKIYNTLTRKIEEFEKPKNETVGIYTCGPTVYNFPHIGNLRTFVFSDLLQRALKFNRYQIKSVQNITDIDDKIIKRAKQEGKEASRITLEYTNHFLSDVRKLNIEPKDEMPKATEYISKMVEFIKVLIDKGFAYEKDGSVYFDISKFANYGNLSGIDLSNLKTGTRILSDEYTKDDVQDFALWKSEEDEKFSYDSPWGKGRPGWHIECSVMSQANLGDTIDIHAGGVDLIFPHHENEIAQSEAKTGKPFARFFVHGAHMLVDGKKMSKSLNNFYTLIDVEEKGFDSLALRYLYLQTHYRQEMNFTWDALKASQTALDRLRSEFLSFGKPGVRCSEFDEEFLQAINDDLNMPQALSVVWEMIKSDNPESAKGASLLMFDEVLGLGLKDHKREVISVPEEVQKLIEKREKLRKEGKFDEADKLREEIKEMGFDAEDNSKGTEIKPK